MNLENVSTEELREELERRTIEQHHRRQHRVYRGEIEDTTDANQHIEDRLEAVGLGQHFYGRGAANY